jgi:hypothetical protein
MITENEIPDLGNSLDFCGSVRNIFSENNYACN